MKTALTVIVLLVTGYYSSGQVKLPAFSEIDIDDVRMKTCELDPTAEAYKLIDLGEVSYTRGRNLFQMNMKRHVRIKILNDKGLEQANVKIPFYHLNNFERIEDLSAYTYNIGADGNVEKTKLSKDAIYTQKIDKRWSTVTFTLPAVKVGSVIEYKYNDVQDDPTRLENWVFQDDIPTRLSRYKVIIPSFFKYVNQVLAYQPVTQTKEEINDMITSDGNVLRYTSVDASFTMEKIPALKSEPYMSSFKDYQQRIEFQLSQIDFGNGQVTNFRTTWDKLAKELLDDEDFGEQMRRNLPHTADLNQKLQNVTDSYAKMIAIHNYVKANMSWNGRQGIYGGDGVKNAWDKKSGSNGEINLILLNLLKEAGVPAKPLLVSTRDHGATNTLYPFLGQFNNVLAHVEIGDQVYVLNGADKYNPSRLLPYDVINTDGFLVMKEGSKWISLENNKQKYKSAVSILADIDASGTLKGEAVVYNYDYSRNLRTQRYKEQRSNFNDYFITNTSTTVDSVIVNNVDTDSLPLEQKLTFSSKLNSSGDYRYFTVNLFSELDKNPFIADLRSTDVDFGYNQSYSIYGSIGIPEDYNVEELPKNISMIMPDTSITLQRFMQVDGNILSFRIMVDFKKPYYTVLEYPDFKEFNKKLYAKLNEQIVIKKKNATP